MVGAIGDGGDGSNGEYWICRYVDGVDGRHVKGNGIDRDAFVVSL